jgi:hypothetical protein
MISQVQDEGWKHRNSQLPTHSTRRRRRGDIRRNSKGLEVLVASHLVGIRNRIDRLLGKEKHTIAVPKATRSAQVPTGYAAFSTLAPEMNSPDVVRMHAPTRNLEYGPVSISWCSYVRWKTYSKQLPWRQWPWRRESPVLVL